MASLTHHLLTMAYNNAWANHRLLKACCDLSQADFVATRTSFFPSIKATLNHLLTVDWYYIDALERTINRQPPNPNAKAFFDPEEPFDSCADLHREQHQTDRRLIAVCRALTDGSLEQLVSIPRSHGIKSEQISRLLAHLFHIKFTIVVRLTPCLPEQRLNRPSSMSSFVPTRQN
ncbi:hypothetical protein NC974_00455 [Leptolyngbya sp. SLC-A1]|uniref:DinB family protein n=1 Tax=unclassified Phormidium TaxID=2609805 RepID=UPI0018F04092|nr:MULTISPECIES: DinB family protein [Cyanophyceae]